MPPGDSQQIRMTTAGSHTVDFDTASTQHCTLLENLYNQDNAKPECDIAILKVEGHIAGSFLRPVRNIELSKDDVVDIVGYPGQVGERWVETHKGIKNITEGRAAVRKLLPQMTLTASRGSVERIWEGIMYSEISTCPGMSGSSLTSKGLAYGCLLVIHILTI
jgi:hypothetical protein